MLLLVLLLPYISTTSIPNISDLYIKRKLSTAHGPETDGQTERLTTTYAEES